MLTARATGQSARFCGEDVQYPQQAQRNAQRLGNLLIPHQPHPLSGGVANRLCNSALVPPGWRAFLLYDRHCFLSNTADSRQGEIPGFCSVQVFSRLHSLLSSFSPNGCQLPVIASGVTSLLCTCQIRAFWPGRCVNLQTNRRPARARPRPGPASAPGAPGRRGSAPASPRIAAGSAPGLAASRSMCPTWTQPR